MGNQKQSVCPFQAPNEQLSLEKSQDLCSRRVRVPETPATYRDEASSSGSSQPSCENEVWCLRSWRIPGSIPQIMENSRIDPLRSWWIPGLMPEIMDSSRIHAWDHGQLQDWWLMWLERCEILWARHFGRTHSDGAHLWGANSWSLKRSPSWSLNPHGDLGSCDHQVNIYHRRSESRIYRSSTQCFSTKLYIEWKTTSINSFTSDALGC